MEINWKDFGIMNLYGILFTIGIAIIAIAIGIDGLESLKNFGLLMYIIPLLLVLFFAIPLTYYFLKNRCNTKNAIAISFVFGIASFSISLLLLAFILEQAGLISPLQHGLFSTSSPSLLVDVLNSLAVALIPIGTLIAIFGLTLNFIICILLKR